MSNRYPYPRFVTKRRFLRHVSRAALGIFSSVETIGLENLPQKGPAILVANHFQFADPVALIGHIPRHLEFLAGTVRPNAPRITQWLPEVYGVYTVQRGESSRNAIRAANAVLAQDGFLVIFPEGGAWADVLRPARPGTALLAVQTGAPLVPIGIDGMTGLFKERRPKVTVSIGKPFGPFEASGRGRERRKQLEKIGDEIMWRIAEQLPDDRHGVFSKNPILKAEAEKVAEFPF